MATRKQNDNYIVSILNQSHFDHASYFVIKLLRVECFYYIFQVIVQVKPQVIMRHASCFSHNEIGFQKGLSRAGSILSSTM